jgi:hypothetical protein
MRRKDTFYMWLAIALFAAAYALAMISDGKFGR